MTRLLLEVLGNIIFDVGRFVGGIRYKLGIIRPIPQKYRSSRWDQDGEDSSS